MTSALGFDNALRARALANLRAFSRHPAPLDGRRLAAVAIVLLADDRGQACFLLTRRAAGLRAHARQWALPGGRVDPGETPERAALRELQEEVGLAASPDGVLGLLDDYPTRSGFVITPVVVWADRPGELTPNPDEVTSIHHVPLSELDRPEVPQIVMTTDSERPLIQVPILSTLVYAPTAALLYQLREVVMHGRDTRVAHFDQPVWAWG